MCFRTYSISQLRSRVTQVLTKVWQDDGYSLAALYGSLYAMNELGVDVSLLRYSAFFFAETVFWPLTGSLCFRCLVCNSSFHIPLVKVKSSTCR